MILIAYLVYTISLQGKRGMTRKRLKLFASASLLVVGFAQTADAAIILGRVSGAADGRALPGARIRVLETGDKAVSEQDGSYRLPNLPAGAYTIEVEYLGYDAVRKTVTLGEDEFFQLDFGLGQLGAAAVDEIVVRGTAQGLNKSLNEQRTAANVTNIVSQDDIGKFPDSNIAESVSRLPGITLVRDQQTGEGSLVTIRGLDAGLNTFSMNGVRLATSGGDDRALNLNQLPPDGLQSVKVSKTLTPDLDGDAIGGAIDFRTASAFDYDKRYAAVSLTGSINDNDEDKGYNVSASFGDKFGANDRWGFFVTGYYQNRDTTGEESENEGDWEPYRWKNGGQDLTIDPLTYQMQGLGLDLFQNELERYGFNSTFDRKFDDGSSLYVRGQYSRYENREDHTYFDVRNEPAESRLMQANIDQRDLRQPGDAIVGEDAALGAIYDYIAGTEIVDQDGDGVITDADRISSGPNGSTDRLYSLIGRSGVWDPHALRIGRGFEISDERYQLASGNIGGEHFIGALTLDWDAAYSYGESVTPLAVGLEFGRRNNSPFDQSGVIFSFPDERYPQWLLPGALGEEIYTLDNLDFRGASGETSKTTSENILVQLNAKYEFADAGALKWVKAGGKARVQKRETDVGTLFEQSGVDFDAALDANGDGVLSLGEASFLLNGHYGSFLSGFYDGSDRFGQVFDRSAVLGFVDQSDGASEEEGDDTRLNEDVFAGYAMAFAQFGKLEVFGGVRVEHTRIDNEFFNEVTVTVVEEGTGIELAEFEAAGIDSTKTDYTNVLPSLHFNYRHTDNLILRGAVWTSIARPEFQFLTSESEVNILRTAAAGTDPSSVTPTTGDIESVAISRGNESLKPAEAINVDLGFEYYTPNGGLFSLNAFYKNIDNFIFKSTEVSGEIAGEYEGSPATINTVLNGRTAEIYGIEGALIQKLTALPSPWDGFGFAANFTYQDSKADPGIPYREGRKIPFINAPQTQYNLQLFYEKYGIEARVAYNFNDRYIEDLRSNAVDKWIHEWSRLDFQARYTMDNGITLRFEAQNLLDGHNYWAIRGEQGDTFQKDYVENGRTVFVGIDYRY